MHLLEGRQKGWVFIVALLLSAQGCSSYRTPGKSLNSSTSCETCVANSGVAALPNITNPVLLNVKNAGVTGDGVTDDSVAIQQAITNASDGTQFYFPAGVYRLQNILITNRARLVFTGDGPQTVLQWAGSGLGSTPMMTFRGVTDLLIKDLVFDNRSIPSDGGVQFFDSRRVLIEATSFIDSAPQTPNSIGRNSYFFGFGTTQNEDITMQKNIISGLTLELRDTNRVEITENELETVLILAARNGSIVEDFLIQKNLIIDPQAGAGIAVLLSSAAIQDAILQRIQILQNTITRVDTVGAGISVGIEGALPQSLNNQFADFNIHGNVIKSRDSMNDQPSAIEMLSGGSLKYFRSQIVRNMILGNSIESATSPAAINLQSPLNSSVRENNILNVKLGLAVDEASSTQVTGNLASAAAYPYVFTNSKGLNAWINNLFLSTPLAPIQLSAAPMIGDSFSNPSATTAGAVPTAYQITVTDRQSDSISLRWFTSVPTLSEVEFGLTAADEFTTQPWGPVQTNHDLELKHLIPNRTYKLRLKMTDVSGRETYSAPFNVQTTP
jgi:hypothetical protein